MQSYMQKNVFLATGIAALLIALPAYAGTPMMAAASLKAPHAVIRIPGGKHGIGFDDIGYLSELGKISIPAGNTGRLVLINPMDGKITASYRVTAPAHGTGHETGTSSAVYGDGYIFASDHGMPGVVVLNAHDGKVVQHVKLASGPDYVRYLESRHELWVTEPRARQIQVFTVKTSPKVVITPNSTIPINGGPESLVFDPKLDRAYTNLWKHKTMVIDTGTHKLLTSWNDSCKGPRGLAIDPARGFLFVACTEGKVAVLDLNNKGKLLATAESGAGIDIISYNPNTSHLYVPGARSASMTIFKVSPTGSLQALAVYRTAKGAHCVTDNGKGRVYVCDPHAGSILEINDQ